MDTQLTGIVRELFNDVDRMDFDAVAERCATDVQMVEEIRRRWMRNNDEFRDYIGQLKPIMSNIKSELSEINEVSWGDAGLVTFWLDQSYVLDGEEQHVSAPSTMMFRRESGDWKIVLFHSIPLPEGD